MIPIMEVAKSMEEVTRAMVRRLYVPPPKSHKGDNGELLVIGGSTRYHGAPLLAARMASKIADFVYFSSTPENNALVRKMKKGLAEFIAVPRREVFKYAAHSDCILMGPGLGLDRATHTLVNVMLKKFPQKKFVLDAGAIRLVDLKLLYSVPPLRSDVSVGLRTVASELRGGKEGLRTPHNPLQLPLNLRGREWVEPLTLRGGDRVRCILTPHRQEFRAAFGVPPTEANVAAMAKKYQCIIVLKGPTDIVCGPRAQGQSLTQQRTVLGRYRHSECFVNKTGNAGMTKGGTGDVLSGLIAGLACKNDLFLAACAGAYVNGLAGDRLKKRVSYYFSASDLIEQVPQILVKMARRARE